jgi:hypothetical protein
MKPCSPSQHRSNRLPVLLVVSTLTLALSLSQANGAPALLDDFSHNVRTSVGIDRVVVTDSSTGGSSQLRQSVADGVLTAEGEIKPGRGQLGWVSLVLLLSSTGEPVDLSRYEGIRLRVRVRKGMVSLTANSTEIKNFDFHASLVPRKGDEFHEVRVPFRDMKRAWSEQTPLNPATINSISLVAVDLQKGAFAYDIDEVGFYPSSSK